MCNARTMSGCSDDGAECYNWVCQCKDGFTEIDGTCKQGENLIKNCMYLMVNLFLK